MSLSRADLADPLLVDQAVRKLAKRLPTYITLKDVKKRWGHAQEMCSQLLSLNDCGGRHDFTADVSGSYLARPFSAASN